jgi:UDP-N-acetylglucosamine--N-acetylmuramyl-(pentapeptide) pyrophosphoryl-undecaprenol N-acetylglucosamine transferase
MGGSQGARSINEAIAALVTRRSLQPNWQVLHVSGTRDYAYMQAEERELAEGNTVLLVEYLADPTDAYAAADVVIARAGASTLAELAVTGTPAILIPYPFAAEGHQQKNADLFAAAGAATILEDRTLDGDKLWWALLEALAPETQRAMRAAMRSLAPVDAGAAIVRRIQTLIPARVIENAPSNGTSRG